MRRARILLEGRSKGEGWGILESQRSAGNAVASRGGTVGVTDIVAPPPWLDENGPAIAILVLRRALEAEA
jgi:hypothetical protein